LSAHAIAQATGREFSYVWPTGPDDFGAPMADLWQYSARELERIDFSNALSVEDDLTALGDRAEWIIRSAYALRYDGTERSWEDLFRELPLAPDTESLKQEVASEFGADTYVGIQMRLHPKAHRKTLDRSPLEWYVGRMHKFLQEDPDTRFYVSCDEPEVQATILRAFPTAFAIDDKGGYNSRRALETTVVDLYLLAESERIVAPHFSSLTYLAWVLSGKRQPFEDSVWVRYPVQAN